MRKFERSSEGMAGTITVVLILALLMTVSTAYLKVMDVEGLVQEMSDYSERATDAAFSGISYAMAVAQSSKAVFRKDAARWPYIVDPKIYNSSLSATYNGLRMNNMQNKVLSQWIYLDEAMKVIDDEEIATPPYRFRVITYPYYEKGKTPEIDPTKYMVKAQGNYFSYETESKEIIATHSAQLLAELEIATGTRRIFLRRYRRVSYQNDTDFYKYNSTKLR